MNCGGTNGRRMPRYGVSALNLQSDELKKNQYKTLKFKVSNMQDTHWGFKIQPDNISLHLRQRHFFLKTAVFVQSRAFAQHS